MHGRPKRVDGTDQPNDNGQQREKAEHGSPGWRRRKQRHDAHAGRIGVAALVIRLRRRFRGRRRALALHWRAHGYVHQRRDPSGVAGPGSGQQLRRQLRLRVDNGKRRQAIQAPSVVDDVHLGARCATTTAERHLIGEAVLADDVLDGVEVRVRPQRVNGRSHGHVRAWRRWRWRDRRRAQVTRRRRRKLGGTCTARGIRRRWRRLGRKLWRTRTARGIRRRSSATRLGRMRSSATSRHRRKRRCGGGLHGSLGSARVGCDQRRMRSHLTGGTSAEPVNSLAYPAHARDNPAACTILGG